MDDKKYLKWYNKVGYGSGDVGGNVVYALLAYFVMIYLTDMRHFAGMNEVYAEFFPGDKPARYCIQCGLVRPDFLVEIASIAHIGKP